MVDARHQLAEPVALPESVLLEAVVDAVAEMAPAGLADRNRSEALAFREPDRTVRRRHVGDDVVAAEALHLRLHAVDEREFALPSPPPEQLQQLARRSDVEELA